jgi:hypothetical protein
MIRAFKPTDLDLVILNSRREFLENESKLKVLKQDVLNGLVFLNANDPRGAPNRKIYLEQAENELKNHEQESAKLSRDWFTTMAYIKRHGHDLKLDGPICHCDEESDQDGWENIYQEYDQTVGDREFHFYETYGGGPSGGYAVLINDEGKVWSWSQNWGTEKDMRLLNSKIEIREDSESNCYRQIRVVY